MSARSATTVALVVALAHGVNDAYASFLAPLLPRIITKLDISIAAAATLSMVLAIASSIPQPAIGYLSDRFGRRMFVALGPLISGIFLSMIGLAPTFTVLLVLLMVGGLGSALFHPPGASMAARPAAGKGSGLRFSIFSFGGTMGFAVGPLIAVWLVGARGLEGLWIAMIPAFFMFALVWAVSGDAARHTTPQEPPGPAEVLRLLRGPLGALFWISAIGAFAQRVYQTLQPISVSVAGGSEALGALSLTVYLGAQSAGTLTGGWLTDRMNRPRLLALLTGFGAPLHVLAVALEPGSAPALVAAAGAGFLNMAILPPLIVMTQEMLPRAASAGAGIVMGLAWATGSFAVLGSGALADAVGPQAAATWSMPMLLVATVLATSRKLRIPEANPWR